jgi:uncharacterized protein
MLLIKTHLKEVEGKGIGLFSTDFVAKGNTCWSSNEDLDRIIFPSKLKFIGPIQLEFLATYGCVLEDGSIHICLDNARFINHSEDGNVKDGLDEFNNFIFKAIRDIEPGEEITTDYADICESCKDGVNFDPK